MTVDAANCWGRIIIGPLFVMILTSDKTVMVWILHNKNTSLENALSCE